MGSQDDAGLQQLMEMGIPSNRARTALMRTKGDVMSAAERVFAGEYDDIPSDDEAGSSSGGSSSALPQGNAERNGAFATDREEALSEEDEDIDVEDNGGFELDDEPNGDGERLLSDPYAGIFFSKDRVEEVVEPVDKPEIAMITIPSPPGDKVERKEVKILSRGEWMSGCPEGNEQSFLFQLYTMLEDPFMCPCDVHTFTRRKQDFFARLPIFPAYLAHLSQIIRRTCPKCNQQVCMACGDRISASSSNHRDFRIERPGQPNRNSSSSSSKGKGKEDDTKTDTMLERDELLHCLPLQGLIIGIGLHMIEETFKAKLEKVEVSPKPAPEVKRRFGGIYVYGSHEMTPSTDVDSDEDDIFSATNMPGSRRSSSKGIGYAGNLREDRSGQLAAEKAQEAADKKMVDLLAQVSIYLPSLSRESGARSSDHLVHPTALAHLRRKSGFVNDLLRNDSLLDMSNRGRLYRALLDWLEIISSHEALASMMAMPQMRPVSTRPSPTDLESVIVTYEGASSPRELLESCVIQAKAALKGLKATTNQVEEEQDPVDEESERRLTIQEAARVAREREATIRSTDNSQLEEFCQRIISSAESIDRSLVQTKGQAFVDRMREELPRLPDVDENAVQSSDTHGTDQDIIQIYEDWATRVRFQYCDLTDPGNNEDDKVKYQHAFDKAIQELQIFEAPKRSLAIAKELAILTRSLPVAWSSSIFLRVDEARVDCIKAMIVGPEGTPYENGLFLFDIFLPLDYGHSCPKVLYMTTNGGRYRYNPNLYADGKVCLSLLGTWSGPGWVSGQSTLLQVLISIQSLILCEEPYLNEPGWASQGGSASSKAYSANVRRMVLVDAMANNLKDPPFPFETEVKTHFKLKAKSIGEQLEKWRDLDDGKPIAAGGQYNGGVDDADSTPPPEKKKKKKPSSKDTAFDKAAKEVMQLLERLNK